MGGQAENDAVTTGTLGIEGEIATRGTDATQMAGVRINWRRLRCTIPYLMGYTTESPASAMHWPRAEAQGSAWWARSLRSETSGSHRDARGTQHELRAQGLCVSGGSHGGVAGSSHPRARLHIGHGPSPGGETPRSVVRNQRCASQHPHEHTSSDRDSVRARTDARSAQRRGTTR